MVKDVSKCQRVVHITLVMRCKNGGWMLHLNLILRFSKCHKASHLENVFDFFQGIIITSICFISKFPDCRGAYLPSFH